MTKLKFTLEQDILAQAGVLSTWVERGEYPVVRFFDNNRLLVDITQLGGIRQLTVIPIHKGSLSL